MAEKSSRKPRAAQRPRLAKAARRENLPQHFIPAPFARLQELGPGDFHGVYDDIADELRQGDAPTAARRLLQMINDETYYDYDEAEYEGGESGDPRGWTRLHALRVLSRMGEAGQIGIEPLLPLLNSEDDFLREDVPFYYAAMGEPAVKHLSRALADHTADTYYRAGAGEGLAEIGEKHPGLRRQIVSTLERALQQEHDDDALAGFLVINLCDLKAVESMPVIEQAYEADRVDDTIVSLAEVQEHLGFEVTAAPPQWTYGPGEPRRIDPDLETLPDEDEDETVQQPYIAPEKIGRNDPCPCGSGKKYKKCCGAPA